MGCYYFHAANSAFITTVTTWLLAQTKKDWWHEWHFL